MALADQGRAAAGLGPLANGPAALYSLSSSDFHDITTGGNGYSAVWGYDLVTGRGSPRADLVIADLVKYVARHYREHKRIFQAIRAGDSQLAAQRMEEHLRLALEVIKTFNRSGDTEPVSSMQQQDESE